MRNLAGALLILAAVGCSSSEPSPEPPFVVTDDVVGGSRLKARWVGSADRWIDARDFLDTERDEVCSFTLVGDGTWRCIPSLHGADWAPLYLNADCTQPVVALSSCIAQGMVSVMDAATCPASMRIYEATAPVGTGTQLHARDYKGDCVTSRLSSPGDLLVGAEVDYGLFVGATLKVGPERGGLAEEYLDAEDGSRQFHSLRDVALGARCTPKRMSDGAWRCMAEAHAFTGPPYRTEADCTGQASITYDEAGSCTIDRSEQRDERDSSCLSTVHLYEVGDEIGGYWYESGATCRASTPDPGVHYFRTGSELAPSGFLEGVARSLAGPPQGIAIEFEGGWDYRMPAPLDVSVGGELIPGVTADGVERWVPYAMITAGEIMTGLYSDAECTQPVALVLRDSPWSLGDPQCFPVLAEEDHYDSCYSHTHFYAVGEAITGPVYALQPDCAPTTPILPWLYRVGAEVSPELFSPVVRELR